jgi:LacI family transcriptional regulator
MGYVPDSSAQGLRTKTTKLFGLVIPATTNPDLCAHRFAIEERAHELGYDLLDRAHAEQAGARRFVLRKLLSRRVDGLFITPVYRFEAEARIYQEIAARKIPTVLLGPPAPFCKNFPAVEIEELVASYNATKHLLGSGPQKNRLFHRPARCAVGARTL